MSNLICLPRDASPERQQAAIAELAARYPGCKIITSPGPDGGFAFEAREGLPNTSLITKPAPVPETVKHDPPASTPRCESCGRLIGTPYQRDACSLGTEECRRRQKSAATLSSLSSGLL